MRMRRGTATMLGLLLVLAGCAGPGGPARLPLPPSIRTIPDHILYEPTTWQGDVRIVRPLIVTRTATLIIRPGTRVFFDIPEPPEGKAREPWIRVMGTLVALGTEKAPIRFASVEVRNTELDDMIQLDGAKEAHFRWCVFERGPWAVHAHETPVDLRSCTFRSNYGGLRFQGGKVVVRRCRFEGNRIGIRCLNASPVIEESWFVGNLAGIFFRQGVVNAVLRRNNFDNEEYDIKLGEGQTMDVDAGGNWWKADREGKLAERIFDRADSEGIGTVRVEPRLPAPWEPAPGGR